LMRVRRREFTNLFRRFVSRGGRRTGIEKFDETVEARSAGFVIIRSGGCHRAVV